MEKDELLKEREMDRINDFYHFAKINNGVVKTKDLARKWNIHPEMVQSYVQYLMRKYVLPISHIEKGYPSYHIREGTNIDFFDVETVEKEKDADDFFYPKANSEKRVKRRRCQNCGRIASNDQYCGYCGSDLKAAK